MHKIRVMVVDDHLLIREFWSLLISQNNHRHNIHKKLDVKNAVALIEFINVHGL